MVRGQIPRVFRWLYRHDRSWLREHSPKKVKKQVRSFRVDWKSRDTLLAEEVKKAATHLKDMPGRPVRLSLSALGREVGQLSILQQHLDKLPLTAQALEEFTETREIFAVRRVYWVMEHYFHQRGISPTRWELIKRAGVERLATLPLVSDALDRALSNS